MMKRMKLVVAGLLIGILAQAQVGDDAVLMTVDSDPVTRGEFEAIYKKNNKDAKVDKEALDEYMELFINYKLKVREAEALGMDTIQKFQKELAGYRTQLARPYLIDRELNDKLMQEAYSRKQEEVRASHILLQLKADATPEDTLEVYGRIMKLRKRILGGEDFAKVASSKGGSEDPSAASNGGDLGWFSALQMVYPFESAAYNTKVGEVSMPVRTRFGYHIIKVHNKRPARGEMLAAHIMLRAADEGDVEKTKTIEAKINEIHQLAINDPKAFGDLALKYSEDQGSSTKGGELPKFGTGKMIEKFEDEAFGLQNDGDISKPFKTQYGWHIVKRLKYDPVPTFDEAKSELKNRISKDSRADRTKNSFINRLKKDYNYKEYPKNLGAVTKMLDARIFTKNSNTLDTLTRGKVKEGVFTNNGRSFDRQLHGTIKNGNMVNIRARQHQEIEETLQDTVVVRDVDQGWAYDRTKGSKLSKPLFDINGKPYDQQDFLNYLEANQKKENEVPLDEYAADRFKQYTTDRIMEYEDSRLEEKHPEFRMLMKEYRDGILLFELTDQKVWSKAVEDTTGLESYYGSHKQDLMWPKRWIVTIYNCADANVAKQVRKLLKKKVDSKKLLEEVNAGSTLALNIDAGTFNAEEKPFLSPIKKKGLSDNLAVDGQVLVLDVKEILEPMPKTLDEARGTVTAAYQDQLEKEWVKELRGKYKVDVNKDVLYSIK